MQCFVHNTLTVVGAGNGDHSRLVSPQTVLTHGSVCPLGAGIGRADLKLALAISGKNTSFEIYTGDLLVFRAEGSWMHNTEIDGIDI